MSGGSISERQKQSKIVLASVVHSTCYQYTISTMMHVPPRKMGRLPLIFRLSSLMPTDRSLALAQSSDRSSLGFGSVKLLRYIFVGSCVVLTLTRVISNCSGLGLGLVILPKRWFAKRGFSTTRRQLRKSPSY